MKRRGRVRERIIRILLNEPDGALTMYKVAKKAKCSFSWVHEFLGKLEAMGLVDRTKVRDYAGLIEYWREVKTKPDRKEYMHRNPLGLLERTKLQYALTTYQAENIVQHYLFPSRIDLYVRRKDEEHWHELIAGEGLVGKGNLRLLLADDHIFYGSFERAGLKVVSLPQLIVDLFDEGGVCVEAAEKLLEKVTEDAVRAN
jgi:DNA-binding Lrp family transcriptional regulator